MTSSSNATPRTNDVQRRKGSRAPPLHSKQRSIEEHAAKLRAQLRLSDFQALDQFQAFALIPNCEIFPITTIPGVKLRTLEHFRRRGSGNAAYAVPAGDGWDIFFNDEIHPHEARVYLMEEYFHIVLEHPLDTVRAYKNPHGFRTFSRSKENEALGCSEASLVPYSGLQSLLELGERIERIAERYIVPIEVIEHRIEATRLGSLVSSSFWQMPLLESANNFA